MFNEQVYHDASGPPATAAITGGTGEVLGATGAVITTSGIHGGDFQITITK